MKSKRKKLSRFRRAISKKLAREEVALLRLEAESNLSDREVIRAERLRYSLDDLLLSLN